MARPRNEREARRAGWTETQIRHDWPLRKKRENLPDGAGPTMWGDDWAQAYGPLLDETKEAGR